MTVTVDWDSPDKTTIHYTYVGSWTWAEYEQAARKALILAREEGRTVDVIADFSRSGMIPQSIIGGFERSMQSSSLKFNTVVVVSKSALFLGLIDVFRKLNSRLSSKLIAANSIEEARELIAARHSQG